MNNTIENYIFYGEFRTSGTIKTGDLLIFTQNKSSSNPFTLNGLELNGNTINNANGVSIINSNLENSGILFKDKTTESNNTYLRANGGEVFIKQKDEIEYKLWSSNNDGSGSGLNADKLDGKHASSFSLTNHNHNRLPQVIRLGEGSHGYIIQDGGSIKEKLGIYDSSNLNDNALFFSRANGDDNYINLFSVKHSGDLESKGKLKSNKGKLELSDKISIEYNNTDECIDFKFI